MFLFDQAGAERILEMITIVIYLFFAAGAPSYLHGA